MNPDFVAALQVTLVGMVLVFSTLIICALVISGLSALFKSKPEEEEKESGGVVLIAPVSVELAAPAPQLAARASDEAAAVALAVTLARRAMGARLTMRSTMPASRIPPSAQGDESLAGDVVTVIAIDPGPGTWSSYGRAQATR